MRRTDLAAFLLLSVSGLVAGFVAEACRRPEPRPNELGIHREPFSLTRTAGDPFMVTEATWLELPMLREDFDLRAELELAEGAELDLVLRRVEPRPLQGVSLPAHSRFCVLRLSTIQEGPAWRTPETALLGVPGGVKLAGGLPASVDLKLRGRAVNGSVAYKPVPEVIVQDDHGSLALIARGGSVAVRSLQMIPAPSARQFAPRWVGLLAGVAMAALCAARKHGLPPAMLAAAALVAAPSAFALVAGPGLPPLAQPDLSDEWTAALAGLPLSLCVLLVSGSRSRMAFVLAFVFGAIVSAGWLAQRVVQIRERFPATPGLDALFGVGAREAVTETLARRVRGPHSIHTLAPLATGQRRVFLLGGQLMWRRGAAPDQHVEPLLEGELCGPDALRPAVEPMSLPTEDGHSAQQWQLFDRCFRAFAPAVVVFGVPRDEDAPGPDGRPRSSAAALAATVAEAKKGCEAMGSRLLLVADSGLPAPLVEVLRKEGASGVPLLELTENDAAIGIARKLAERLRPLLPR